MKPNFLVDENLARLAKWLRFFGFDAGLAMGWSDFEVTESALNEKRVLLTMDRDLALKHPGPKLLISSDELSHQLLAVLQTTGVPSEQDWFTRCVECNFPLRQLQDDEKQRNEFIPCWIKEKPQMTCWTCDECRRAYWKGSHYERARNFLNGLVAQQNSDAEQHEQRASENPDPLHRNPRQ